jgi:hypothetical protein
MKLGDKGAFFIKKKDDSIWTLIYFRSNYLLKKHPNLNEKPNKIFAVFFDKNGRDFIRHNITIKDFKEELSNKNEKVYNYNESTSKETHEKFKELGTDKFYTKQWFEKQYNFIKEQLI